MDQWNSSVLLQAWAIYLNVYKLCKFLIQAVQLSLLSFSCTPNTLLILILKYARMHSLLQNTHLDEFLDVHLHILIVTSHQKYS